MYYVKIQSHSSQQYWVVNIAGNKIVVDCYLLCILFPQSTLNAEDISNTHILLLRMNKVFIDVADYNRVHFTKLLTDNIVELEHIAGRPYRLPMYSALILSLIHI
eukprot:TRINITY_DN12598_c0_g1_i7.p2 TRINITY_DN12598_c0_g1~~TRINITY_DN12598_c0_g1_i7.p2  ORF type:complete len:105 (-),score=5.35 TRINITY_DN12598_c0_g1_i7:4-318(-)